MYELTEELSQYCDANSPVDLTGTRFFQDLSGGLGILLTPLAQYAGVSMSLLLQARLDTDRTHGHRAQAFVVTLFDIDDERDASTDTLAFVLWDEARGLGTVVVHGEKGTPDTLEDTWADDLADYLTLVFEQPGPEESPT
jgi:hypothetical protein